MRILNFEKKAGIDAMLAGVSGFLYAVSFIVISRSDPVQGAFLSGLFLLATGFFAIKAFVCLYRKLRSVDEGWALWAFVLGIGGAFGAAIHGAYDLANAVNPPEMTLSLANFPSQIDPRGFLTFGVTGVAIGAFSYLMRSDKSFPTGLALLGYATSVLMMVLYLGRLTVLNPADPIIVWPALINGFVLSPVWYVWLGLNLWKRG